MNMHQGSKYLWKLPPHDAQAVCSLAAQYNLSFPVAQTLISRGYCSKEQVDAYLFSSLEKDVFNPALLKDAQKAVERIARAIKNKEKMLVFGDYDVDGITSSALMMICLMPLDAAINFFLPHRARDGYGLSTKIVQRAAQNGYGVIITVDNGITAFEPARLAKEAGIDLIITDHHRPHEQVPDAYAIVNPHQHDCTYPYKTLAGVGVTFKVLSLLYQELNKELPPKAYELLLLGTIADVVPLTGENRFWVRHGLQKVNQTESFSFKVLKQNGNLAKPKVSATDIGFSVTPQINALGRLEDPRQGVKFLIGNDRAEVEHVGKVLLELNQARKEIERTIFDEIVMKIESGAVDLSRENIIIAASSNWPPGVIGLVASRLVSKYGRPTILLHIGKDGTAKGSCRSIPEFNMFNALHESRAFLLQFGGHSVAAGLSLKVDQIPFLKESLEQRIAEQLTPADLLQKLDIDAELTLPDVNQKLVHDLELLQPFGCANSQPAFYLKNVVQVQKPVLLKDLHLKCSVFADGVIKPLILFNRPDLFAKFSALGQETFDVAVQITENHWQGKVNLELLGLDVARV